MPPEVPRVARAAQQVGRRFRERAVFDAPLRQDASRGQGVDAVVPERRRQQALQRACKRRLAGTGRPVQQEEDAAAHARGPPVRPGDGAQLERGPHGEAATARVRYAR